jgi:very-short-patch-repair endonuclease
VVRRCRPHTDQRAPPPTPQHQICDARGRLIGRVDLAYPHSKIAIEYEGDHHRERTHFRRDIARYNALRQAGWLVLRFTADDVLHHPQRLIDQVTNALDERR